MSSFRLNLLRSGLLFAAFAFVMPTSLLAQEVKPAAGEANSAGADPASLAAIVDKLTPENRKTFAGMLANDWQDRRPEWVEMLIPLLKREPINLGVGWFQPGVARYDWKWISTRLDANKDGLIAKGELPQDLPYAEMFHSRLDRDGDGELRSADFDFFSRQPPTPPQMMSRFLLAVIDTDSNGRITPEEIQNWIKGVDKDKAGFLTVDDLDSDFNSAMSVLNSGSDDMPGPDKMLSMFFSGELGIWGAGPKPGEDAPDFTLPTHDGKETFTLSKSKGKPVILIFGSFT